MSDRTIAALFVQTNGVYFGLEGVDPWDEARDARKYAGPHPVVAHPPCARWSKLAGLVQHRWGHRKGDDGGCFASALRSVRAFGGVLEHPAHSKAWFAFGLPWPPADGGWQVDVFGGASCHVEQRWYGHRARKATWLYAVWAELPVLRWGPGPAPEAWASETLGRRGDGSAVARPGERMGKRERSSTPLPFRDLLLSIARSVPR